MIKTVVSLSLSLSTRFLAHTEYKVMLGDSGRGIRSQVDLVHRQAGKEREWTWMSERTLGGSVRFPGVSPVPPKFSEPTRIIAAGSPLESRR